MADGGERLAPESVSRDARQVPELPQLARGEPGDVMINNYNRTQGA